jgi:hypothetical protein
MNKEQRAITLKDSIKHYEMLQKRYIKQYGKICPYIDFALKALYKYEIEENDSDVKTNLTKVYESMYNQESVDINRTLKYLDTLIEKTPHTTEAIEEAKYYRTNAIGIDPSKDNIKRGLI